MGVKGGEVEWGSWWKRPASAKGQFYGVTRKVLEDSDSRRRVIALTTLEHLPLDNVERAFALHSSNVVSRSAPSQSTSNRRKSAQNEIPHPALFAPSLWNVSCRQQLELRTSIKASEQRLRDQEQSLHHAHHAIFTSLSVRPASTYCFARPAPGAVESGDRRVASCPLPRKMGKYARVLVWLLDSNIMCIVTQLTNVRLYAGDDDHWSRPHRPHSRGAWRPTPASWGSCARVHQCVRAGRRGIPSPATIITTGAWPQQR